MLINLVKAFKAVNFWNI